MPQTLVLNLMHITFSTKNRKPLIPKTISEDLHAYLAGTAKELGCPPLQVGGVEDHVHLFINLSRKLALMTFVEKIKSSSSRWMKTKGVPNFYWQNGYGGFSVNPTQVDVVVDYVRNQEEHHKKMTFQTEFRAILKKYGVPYDERYVWD